MATTLKDIAEAVDMSISSVSLVLGNKPNRISKEKQAAIWKAAQKLHYVPDYAAHSFKGENKKLIGAVFAEGRNLHYSTMLASLNNSCMTRGWHMLTALGSESVASDVANLKLVMSMGVDGIVFCPSHSADRDSLASYTEMLQGFSGPVIFVERYYEYSSNYSAIAANRKKGTYMAVQHLISLGHENIGILCGKESDTQEWVAGMGSAFEEKGLDISSLQFFFGDDSPLSGYDQGTAIADAGVTGVFCTDDEMALGLCRRLHELNVKIPEDISIVGFNDNYFGRCLEVPLTSLSVQGDMMGYMLAERLFSELEDPKQQKCISLIDPILKVRASTAPPREIRL